MKKTYFVLVDVVNEHTPENPKDFKFQRENLNDYEAEKWIISDNEIERKFKNGNRNYKQILNDYYVFPPTPTDEIRSLWDWGKNHNQLIELFLIGDKKVNKSNHVGSLYAFICMINNHPKNNYQKDGDQENCDYDFTAMESVFGWSEEEFNNLQNNYELLNMFQDI